MRCAVAASLVFFLAIWATSALAQPEALSLPANEKPRLDGRLDEPVWLRAPLTRSDQVQRDQDFIADGMYIAAGDSEDFAPDFDVDAARPHKGAGWAQLRLDAERVDIEVDRLGRGADGFIKTIVRGQVGGFGVELEQKLQAAFIDRGGQHVLTDSAARWLGVLHLTVRHDSRTTPLVFQHRGGATRATAEPGRQRKHELFVKAALAI